jgi:hypothetical protein
MAVSLTNADGNPISTFGSGNTAYAQGNRTNAFESNSDSFDYANADDTSAPTLLSPRTFGDTADVNAGEATQTHAGSTSDLGYDTTVKRSMRGGGGHGGGGSGRSAGGSGETLLPDAMDENGQIGLKPASPGTAEDKPDGPTEDEQAETAIAQENIKNGNEPGYTYGGNMQGGSRNAQAAYGATEGTATGGHGSSYTNGGTTSSTSGTGY